MTKLKKIIIIIVVLAIAAAFIYFAVTNATAKQAETGIPKNAYPVELESAHKETIITKVTAKGSVSLIDKVIVYPETQARIKKVHAKTGDTVTSGQILVEYDDKYLDTLNDQIADAQLALKAAKLALQSAQLPPSETEKMQSESQISQAKKIITDIYSQIDQIDLSLEQTNDTLTTAEKKYEDIKTLYESGVVSKSELDSAYDTLKKIQDQLSTLEAQKQAALSGIPTAEENQRLAEEQYAILLDQLNEPRVQNQISQQQINVEQAELRISQLMKQVDDFKKEEIAQVDGVVTNLYVSEGETSVLGMPLMDIADTSGNNLVITVNVPENDTKDLAVGQKVEIKGDALGKDIYMGKLTKIYPVAEVKQMGNSMETVLVVEVSPEDSSPKLRAGYTVETAIITKVSENAVVVPLMSTLSDPDGSNYVFVMKEDFTAEKRVVTMGEYSGIYVQVNNISEGDNIILSPSPQIADGEYVKPISRS